MPDDELRELSTDRPDQTESAITVDAGHFQAEMDILSLSRSWHESGEREIRFALGPINLKLGILSFLDLQVVVSPFTLVRSSNEPEAIGFGDTTIRVKVNVVGPDGGPFSLALMPFASLPTATDGLGSGMVEAGLAIPIAIPLPEDVDLGLTLQGAAIANGAGGYDASFFLSAALGREIYGPLSFFAELVALLDVAGLDGRTTAGFEVHGGLIVAIGRDAQLDAAVYVPLIGPSYGLFAFIGLSFRI